MKQGEYRIGEAVKITREELGISNKGLAEKAGISASHLSLIENGKHGVSISSTEAIAKALGLDLEKLIFLAKAITPLRAHMDELQDQMREIAKKVLLK